jgi:2TM domain
MYSGARSIRTARQGRPGPENVDRAERQPRTPTATRGAGPPRRGEALRPQEGYPVLDRRVYLPLSGMWFAIDMADGTENLWFYWPMLGVGTAVAVVAIVLFGTGGLFGVSWERRHVERYVRDRGRPRGA